jgi:hypothetical protein
MRWELPVIIASALPLIGYAAAASSADDVLF